MLKLDNNALLRDAAYIDGEWRSARSGARFAVKNPATGDVIAEIADLAEEDVREAIEAAHRAWGPWRAKTAKERAVLMRRWYELMIAAQDDLAQLMTAEQGKPLAESKGEVVYGASFIEWFAEEGKRIYGDVIPTIGSDRRLVVVKQPVGVTAANTASGGSPRATSVASRRSAAWVSASSRSLCSAWALAIAVAASSMKSAIRDSVPAGKSSWSSIRATSAAAANSDH